MNTKPRAVIQRILQATLLGILALVSQFGASQVGNPQPVITGEVTLSPFPLIGGDINPPIVMLNLSKDQQLFKKAYNDYSDLDGDGEADTRYKNSINYLGYFDPMKCYQYVASARRFEPSRATADKLCNQNGVAGEWSGNFLNWASMTRMDIVRKVLYGGLRSPNRGGNGTNSANLADGDTLDGTVIERSHLPTDAHAFAKYYNPHDPQGDGTPLERLTPFALAPAVTKTSSSMADISKADRQYQVSSVSGLAAGAPVEACQTGTRHCVRGTVKNVNSATNTFYIREISQTWGSGFGISNWTIRLLRDEGISLCNATIPVGGTSEDRSETSQSLPQLRVAQGNYALWASNEQWQCQWNEERQTTNENQYAISGVPAFVDNPKKSVKGLGVGSSKGEYFVRVSACVPGLEGTESCKRYPEAKALKPVGLLQSYGEDDQLRFGLFTGSYRRNTSGGVLRKNPSALSDEIDLSTGIFKPLKSTGVEASTAPGNPARSLSGGGMIDTFNRLRVSGYWKDGHYTDTSGTGDACSYTETDLSDDKCRSWGNPIAEIYYETLRYLGGAVAPTSAFVADDASIIPDLKRANWPNTSDTLLSTQNVCTKLNILIFNASPATNENATQIGSLSFMSGTDSGVVALTKSVGDAEGLTNHDHPVGRNAQSTPTDPDYELCTAKTLNGDGLGAISGLCPDGPTLSGTFFISGLAAHARKNRIRKDLESAIPADYPEALRIGTYGVSLAGDAPRIEIFQPGLATSNTSPSIVIQPAQRVTPQAGKVGGGALVDMQIISRTIDPALKRERGSVQLVWEQSEQGGNYDSDITGMIEYEADFVQSTINVRTRIVREGLGGTVAGFGYIVSGTTRDGPHFHSGVNGFSYSEPLNLDIVSTGLSWLNTKGGCKTCSVDDGWTEIRYALAPELSGATTGTLKEPLWYAAKYGSLLKEVTANQTPDLQQEWDVINNITGESTPDGQPDNYFSVANPLGLEASMRRIFASIAIGASLTRPALSSQQLVNSAYIYVASFESGTWKGDLKGYKISRGAQGATVQTTADWSAAAGLSAGVDSADPESRSILTYQPEHAAGIAFRWPVNAGAPSASELSAAQVAALMPDASEAGTMTKEEKTAFASLRLKWLRGDRSNEGNLFRTRPDTVLGDIVNSSPTYVGAPAAGYPDPDYQAFRIQYASRQPMIYVGANDGMLHGFTAKAEEWTTAWTSGGPIHVEHHSQAAGREKIAYIPGRRYEKLARFSRPGWTHEFSVDGSPSVQDVKINDQWRTYLIGGLNGGGQTVYALDVTDPAQFSEGQAATLVRWEFSDADDPNLGYTYGKPLIRKLADGRWYALISSGPNHSENDGHPSLTGRGSLFILDLAKPIGTPWLLGSNYFRLSVPEGDMTAPTWLAPPTDADINGDGTSDFVYAGDAQGHVWRFDLRSALPSEWGGIGSIAKLGTAHDGSWRQPITAAPSVTLGPHLHGAMVIVGTGQYWARNNISPPGPEYKTQSLYGFWDRLKPCASACGVAQVDRGQLLNQTITQNIQRGSVTYSVLSLTEPNYLPPDEDPDARAHLGWRMDLPDSGTGERIAWPSQSVSGYLYVNSIIPSELTSCSGTIRSGEYLLNPLTGGQWTSGGFDVTGDGRLLRSGNGLSGDTFEVNGQTAFAGRRLTSDMAAQKAFIFVDGKTSAVGLGANNAPSSENLPGVAWGRASWRQIFNE